MLCGDGCGGSTNCTNLAPNTVVDAMSTTTFEGINCNAAGSIASLSAAWPSGNASMALTRPTSAPCSLTLASGFITRPARGDNTVRGTVWVKPPRNMVAASTMTPTMATTVTSPTSGRRNVVHRVLLRILLARSRCRVTAPNFVDGVLLVEHPTDSPRCVSFHDVEEYSATDHVRTDTNLPYCGQR